jgi:hypothetical protein
MVRKNKTKARVMAWADLIRTFGLPEPLLQ